ncbi:MAG TPA: NYN domain-containing protein [Thermoanaerobaculia bacterium]|nr:NYN domain-containing protein [Thermoanaerobaculia bacterium]
MPDHPNPPHVRSALFVDFDNIYLGLQREDPNAAEQFATNPSHWLQWLQESLSLDLEELGGRQKRKILSRRCYLNPSQFGRFRPYFTRSAFEVVDCPPLTSGGKTSADIQMVMDILDALGHATRFEEFIILSGDADFTPVLLRLSKHDRRSAVLAVGPASVAYKAACDLLIDQDVFLEEAIGVIPTQSTRTEGPPTTAMQELLRRIADKVYEKASTLGELVATDLPGIFREFPEFTASTNWLGFNSLRNMSSAVTQARPDLEMVDGDPWKVRIGDGQSQAEGEGGAPAGDRERLPYAVSYQRPAPVDYGRLTEQILEYVRGVVSASDSAVPMARAAQMVISRFGDAVLSTRWAGAGTFRDLLEGRDNPGFAISSLKPGYLFDPEQHQIPTDGRPDELASLDPAMGSLAYRVHQLTDTPYLTPPEYAQVFRHIADEVTAHGYFLTRTSKAVRDRCIEEGATIARASVNFILRGITFGGHRFAQNGGDDPATLGRCFYRNVLSLCESAGLLLDQTERDRLAEWILGALRTDESSPAPAARIEEAPAPPILATVAPQKPALEPVEDFEEAEEEGEPVGALDETHV